MPEFIYAKGRIIESVQFITEELKEFKDDYAEKTWLEYRQDRKIQKLMDRTVENILTAIIEVSGTLTTQKNIKVESYGDALRKAAELLSFSREDQENLGKLASQRTRLAHRYLNFRWQVIRIFKENYQLIIDFTNKVFESAKNH